MMIRDVSTREYFSLRVKIAPEELKQLEEWDRREVLVHSFGNFLKENAWPAQVYQSVWEFEGDSSVVEKTQAWINNWNLQEKSRSEIKGQGQQELLAKRLQQREILLAELKTRQQWIEQLQSHLEAPELKPMPVKALESVEASAKEADQVATPAPVSAASSAPESEASGNTTIAEPSGNIEAPIVHVVSERPVAELVQNLLASDAANVINKAAEISATSSANNLTASSNQVPLQTAAPASVDIVNIVKKSIAEVQQSIQHNRNNDLVEFQKLSNSIDDQQGRTSKLIAQQETKMVRWLEGETSKLHNANSWNVRQWQLQIQITLKELNFQQDKLKRELENNGGSSMSATPVALDLKVDAIALPLKELRHGYKFLLLGLVLCFVFNLVWEVSHSRRHLK